MVEVDNSYGIDQLFVISRTGSGHVLIFDISFGILSKNPDFELWVPIQNLKEFACVSYQQRIYFIGGYNMVLQRSVQSVKSYNVVTKEWLDLPNMESERHLCTAVVFNGEIIVCGGCRDGFKLHSTSEIYNIARKRWKIGPYLKRGICDMQLIVMEDSIFGFGGMRSSKYKNKFILCSSDEFLECKPPFKEWSKLDENIPLILGKPLYRHSVVEMESKIYIIGGLKTIIDRDGKISEIVNQKVESFLMTDKLLPCLSQKNLKDWICPWDRSLPSCNISRSGAAAIVIGSDIFLFGGSAENQTNGVLEVEKFNPKRCRWNTEFVVKIDADLSMVSALKFHGLKLENKSSIIPNEKLDELKLKKENSIIPESNEESLIEATYKVGWILW